MKKIILFVVFFLIVFFLMEIKKNKLNIYTIENEEYTLKIIEKNKYDLSYVEENLFYYKKRNKIIGCGEVLKLGLDSNKEYLYGEVRYKDSYKGVGIYNAEISIIGRDVFLYEKPFMDIAAEKINKICNGYFILNLKKGDYISNLSKNDFLEIMEKMNITKKEEEFSTFMKEKKKKKYIKNEIEYWMSTREL